MNTLPCKKYHVFPTKFWLEDPCSLGDAQARLDRPTLGLALQAITGHNYLNYHHNIVGNISEQIC